MKHDNLIAYSSESRVFSTTFSLYRNLPATLNCIKDYKNQVADINVSTQFVPRGFHSK